MDLANLAQILPAIKASTFDPALYSRILSWAKDERFQHFLRKYSSKINAKLRKAAIEQQRDVGYELFIAYRFLKIGCSVIYEPQREGPDFKITKENETFYCEVRRVREAGVQKEWDNCIKKLKTELEPLLDVSVKLTIIDFYSFLQFEELKSKLPDLKRFILEKSKEKFNESTKVKIPFFPEKYGYLLFEPVSSDDKGSFSWVLPILFTGREYYKFGDIICEKAKKAKPGYINVIYIRCSSSSHMREDFDTAIDSLLEQAKNNNDDFFTKKKFRGANDFLERLKNISAVVVDTWGFLEDNFIWKNKEAYKPLTPTLYELIKETLEIPFRQL